jgi:hypothetical protein
MYAENIHFLGSSIVLRGTDPLNPAAIASTIIDGSQSGPVVSFSGTENETCLLSGFTIRNGKADHGAGICGGTWGQRTRAAIRNNVITANEAGGADATHGDGGGLACCDGLIENNTITANVARIAGIWSWETGAGGLHACSGEIRNNVISENSSEGFGLGAGLCECHGVIHDNMIVRNQGNKGGGLALCNGIIKNNTICLNSARRGAGLYECEGTIRNNLIIGNVAVQEGGGICFFKLQPPNGFTAGGPASASCGDSLAQQPVVESCTIVGNSAGESGGAIAYCEGTTLNCIIWENTAPRGAQLYESSNPYYSCVQGWLGEGVGNILQHPMFVDPDGVDDDPETCQDNDYRLSPPSPCIDTGKNEDWMSQALDLDGNARIVGESVDMGAYEWLSSITGIEFLTTGDLQLTWSSRPEAAYSIWSCSDPSGKGTWTEETTILSGGELTIWADPNPGSVCKFYRIQIW